MSIKKYLGPLVIVFSISCGCSQAPVAQEAESNQAQDNQPQSDTSRWSYSGDTGPEHWADLNPDWAIARTGKRQSPIDLTNPVEKNLPPIEFNYQPSRINIVNNGYTIQVNYDPGSSITIAGQTYQLVQFHFHAPSEHTIDGKSFEMEAHLVHQSAEGNLAVVGVMLKAGKANTAYQPVWKHLPSEPGDEKHHPERINAADMLPVDRAYTTYSGSLTTPPCSEGVKWLVLSSPVELSPEQVARFTKIYSGNNRPLQALHDRSIQALQD